jgi:hypothetical protein
VNDFVHWLVYAAYVPLGLKLIWNLGVPFVIWRRRRQHIDVRVAEKSAGVSMMPHLDILLWLGGGAISGVFGLFDQASSPLRLFLLAFASICVCYAFLTFAGWLLLRKTK